MTFEDEKIKSSTNVVQVHEQCCLLHLFFEVTTFLAPNYLAGGLLVTCGIKRKLYSGITPTPKTVRCD